MDLRFLATIGQLHNLQFSCKLSRTFHASAKAALGTAMACLLGAVFFIASAAAQDQTRPTVTITGPTSVQTGAFTVDIDFSESVTGFEQADVTVGNGRVTGWAPAASGDVLAIITPAASGTVTVDVAADVAVDSDDNGNTAATRYSVQANVGEPTVTISCPTGVQTGAFTVDIDFSESVTGFEQADVTVGNGRVTGWAPAASGDVLVIITPSAPGTVTVDVPANVAVDDDGYGNTAAQQCSVQVQLPPPQVTIADASASEGDPITFTVTLNRAVSGGLTVTPSFSKGGLTTEGWATQGADYTANTAPLRFAGTAGEKKTFTVATTEDTDIEADKRFTVSLTVSGTTETVTATDTATGTIINDDKCAKCWWDIRVGGDATQYTAQTLGVEEGGTVELTLTQRVDGQRTLTYWTVQPTDHNGSADPATGFVDYGPILKLGPIKATLTFSGRGDRKTIRISTHEDTLVERDEYFRLHMTSNYQNTGYADNRLIYIKNDDQATITVSDAQVGEGGFLHFTATLDKALAHSVTVTPSFTHGTAAGDDYTANTEPITFAGTAGEKKTFQVLTTEDSVVEGPETFTTGLTVARSLPHWWYTGEGDAIAVVAGTGTIIDDDSAAVTIADASADEGDSLTFTVTLNKTVPGGLTVTPSFTDVTATKGTDYTENTDALSFAGTKGEMQTFTVATTQDTDHEADETFTVGLTISGTSETVTSTGTATGTIDDDDRGPAVTIDDAAVGEGGRMTFTVTLDRTVSGGLTVTPSFTDVTATKGTDYTENTAPLTFAGARGETQDFTVALPDDNKPELQETFTVSLAVSGTTETVTATDTATGTILDNDDAGGVIVSEVTIADASAAEGDSLTFTVTLNAGVSGGLTVTPSFTDGTATKGTDYTENTAALTFAGTHGETQTFTVATTEDEVVELDKTFTVGLTVSGTTETVTATDTATGTITDDDTATVTVADVSNAEGGPGFSFEVDGILFTEVSTTATLDKAVQGGFQLYFYASAGTATKDPDGTSYATTDFGANPVSLWFTGNAGERKTLDRNWVAIYQDEVVEGTETFNISYSLGPLPGPGPVLPPVPAGVTVDGPATGTIIDDDIATVTIADASATEGDGITFTLTVDKAVEDGFTMTPSFTDGTAEEGTDYTENTEGIDFTGDAGETQTFTVTTTDNEVVERLDKTFTVGLSVSGTSATVTATDTATGTIIDNDGETTVTVTDASADEGGSLTFTVTLNKAVSGGLTVTPSFTDGTATKGTDYTENTAALTFTGDAGETQTFTVATTQDTDDEPDETFTVGLSVSGTSATVTATDTATGTIVDDDGGAVLIGNAGAHEGNKISFAVVLSKAVPGGLTVTPSFTDVAAKKGIDYKENTAPISFKGTKEEMHVFTVTTTDDEDKEPDETFTVGLSVSGTSETVTAPVTATGTIFDDDVAPAVTIADASADEGDQLRFTVTLDKPVPGGLTVTPSFTDVTPSVTDVTARKGTDYEENTKPISFEGTRGEQQTFRVKTTPDTDIEPDEMFTVSLSVSGTSLPVTATDTATGTIFDDDELRPEPDVPLPRPDAPTVTQSSANPDTELNVNWTAPANPGPAITDYDVKYRKQDETVWTAHPFIGTGTTTAIRNLDPGVTYKVQVKARNDEGDSPWSESGTGATSAKLNVEREVPEHSPPGTPVGDPVAAQDPKGHALTYSIIEDTIVATAGAQRSRSLKHKEFTLDPATGQITVAAGANLDYEIAHQHHLRVRASHPTPGQSDDHIIDAVINVVINVINVDDPNISFVPDSLTVPEGDMKPYMVTLQAEPAGPVTVTLTSEDPEAATVSPTELAFTPENWDTQQRVTVTGVHDDDTDDELVIVTHATSGGSYHVTADFTVTVLDDDTPGVTITPTAVKVDEGATAAEAYTVVLDIRPKGAVTVTPVSGDAGTVTVSSQPLTFTPATWNRPQAVSLTSVRDPDATDETVAVHHEVSGADYAGVTADSVRVRVLDKEGTARRRMAEHWLARFGRTVATDVVDVIGDRFAAPPGESHVTVNGRRLDPGAGGPSGDEEQGMVAVLGTILEGLGVTGPQSEQGAPGVGLPFGGLAGQDGDIWSQGVGPSRDGSLRLPSGREVLTNSAFRLSLKGDRSGDLENWTLWGLGRVTRFQARPEDGLSLDGEVFSGHLGADYRWSPRSLTGVVVSHAMGRGDFDGAPTKGASVIMDNIKSSLTSVHPYLRWTPSEGLDLWGILGFGLGKMELEDSIGRAETDIAMRMAALGVRNALASVGRFDLALKADAFVVEMESDDVPALRSTYKDVERLRLMLEGQTEWAASADSRLVPSMELGVRYDGGDAEKGGGAELGGGLAYVHTTLGLTVEARGRLLLVHRENDFKQWGASVMANLDPGASGEGLSFSLAPVWGEASSRTGALWGNEQVGVAPQLVESPGWQPDRMDVAVGYGLKLGNGRRVLTPFGELSLGGAGSLQMGLRLEETAGAPGGLRLELFGGQRNLQDVTPDYHIGLSGTFEF